MYVRGIFSIRVLSLITAFLIPVFFCGDCPEKTVSVENRAVSFVFKNECAVPLELYLTVDTVDALNALESSGGLELLRAQNGQSVVLFSGDGTALVSAELYVGTLTVGESMTFTAQCGENTRSQMTIRGRPQKNAPGKWIVRISLLLGWGVLAVAGSALLVRRIQTHGKRP